MHITLSKKTAIVTAAGAGIGRASVHAFAQAGADVWAVDINAQSLQALSEELPDVKTYALDVTDANAILDFSRLTGDVDIVFNCVGIVANGGILACTEDDWDSSFNTNVKSCYLMCQTFIPGMLRLRGGSIISMSSVASSLKGVANRFCYGATKAAIIGMNKALAAEYASKNIRCNTICPGTVDTESLRGRINAYDDPLAARQNFIARQPMGRLGSAQEVANLALYLASDASAYTTGADHVIDGGWSI